MKRVERWKRERTIRKKKKEGRDNEKEREKNLIKMEREKTLEKWERQIGETNHITKEGKGGIDKKKKEEYEKIRDHARKEKWKKGKMRK